MKSHLSLLFLPVFSKNFPIFRLSTSLLMLEADKCRSCRQKSPEIRRKFWNFGFLGSGKAENPEIDGVGNMEIEIEA